MEERRLDGYIYIGTGIRYLMHVMEGWLIGGKGGAIDNLKRLVDACQTHGLHVTNRLAAAEFGAVVKEILGANPDYNGDVTKLDGTLTADQAEKIREAAGRVRGTLLAEARGHVVHVARDKRFAIEKLLHNMPALMSPGVFEQLPKVAQYDFREAGRCIAFETPTAAGFHLMRGTEDVLRFFYCSIVKRGRKKALMWGPMVAHLRTRRDSPPAVLLNNLDNLRINFRNPTQHPDMVYDIEEAQDLLALSIDVVNRMIRHLEQKVPAQRKGLDEASTVATSTTTKDEA